MTFAETLRAWRARMGYVQTEAADWLCVNLRTYQDWEQGRCEPRQVGPVLKAIELSETSRRGRANQV
jgi:DNA-binding transcriptional regulator YiaG